MVSRPSADQRRSSFAGPGRCSRHGFCACRWFLPAPDGRRHFRTIVFACALVAAVTTAGVDHAPRERRKGHDGATRRDGPLPRRHLQLLAPPLGELLASRRSRRVPRRRKYDDVTAELLSEPPCSSSRAPARAAASSARTPTGAVRRAPTSRSHEGGPLLAELPHLHDPQRSDLGEARGRDRVRHGARELRVAPWRSTTSSRSSSAARTTSRTSSRRRPTPIPATT